MIWEEWILYIVCITPTNLLLSSASSVCYCKGMFQIVYFKIEWIKLKLKHPSENIKSTQCIYGVSKHILASVNKLIYNVIYIKYIVYI